MGETRLSGMSLFSRISTWVRAISRARRAAPGKFRSAIQSRSLVNRRGQRSIASSRSFCSPAALPFPPPAGPCVMPSSARVETSFRVSALTWGNGDESSPVPMDPNAARFAGVSGTRISVPSSGC